MSSPKAKDLCPSLVYVVPSGLSRETKLVLKGRHTKGQDANPARLTHNPKRIFPTFTPMKYLVLFLLLPYIGFAQPWTVSDLEKQPPIPLDRVYLMHQVDQAAEPVGGMKNFISFLFQNMKYTESAYEAGLGEINMSFIVDRMGSLIGIEVKTRPFHVTDMEPTVEEVLLSYPKGWSPAIVNSQRVIQRIRLRCKVQIKR